MVGARSVGRRVSFRAVARMVAVAAVAGGIVGENVVWAQARRKVPGQIECATGRVETAHFKHQFSSAKVNASPLAANLAKHWKLEHPFGSHPSCAAQPALVLETAFYLEAAWTRYETLLRAQGRAMPTPRLQLLPVLYHASFKVPMQFQHQSPGLVYDYPEVVNVNLSPERMTQRLHRHRTAHELFHFVQAGMIGADRCARPEYGGLWWVEAAAEYAACDVVWPELSPDKGGPTQAYPYLLDRPLWTTGAPSNDHGYSAEDFKGWTEGNELEYDKGHFIEFVVQRVSADQTDQGLATTFFSLDSAVMAHFKNVSRIGDKTVLLSPVDRFLKARGVTLAEVYREFAAFYFLSADSPLVRTQTDGTNSSTPLSAVVRACPTCRERRALALAPGRLSAPASFTFALPAGYTAKMWALELEELPGGATQPPRRLVVRAATLDQVRVQVFKGPRAPVSTLTMPVDPVEAAGSWLAGQPRPEADLNMVHTEAEVTLRHDEALYVVAAGVSEILDGKAVVTVSDAPAVSLQPAACRTESPQQPAYVTATFESTPQGGRRPQELPPLTMRWQWRRARGGAGQDHVGETVRVNPRTGRAESAQPLSFPAPGSYLVTCAAVDAAGAVVAQSSPLSCEVGAGVPAKEPIPAPPPAPGKPTGHWRYVDTRRTEYSTPPGDTSVVERTVSVAEGSISGSITTDSGLGEGPSTWAGSCTWTWQASGGLDRLEPGSTLTVSMTATDQSVPEAVSGWSHGVTGVSGSIRFDRPFLPLGVTHREAAEIVGAQAGWKQTATATKTWTVVPGPGPAEWEGRASLVASCAFGKVERVYEWVGGAAGPTNPLPASPPSAGSSAAFDLGRIWHVKQWIGDETWTWVWRRQGDSNTFEGVARNNRTGLESRHAIHFVSEENGQVILSRPDAYGRYVGTLSPDRRRVVSGILDSVSGAQGWTAEIN